MRYTWERAEEGTYIIANCHGALHVTGTSETGVTCHHTQPGQKTTLELREEGTFKVLKTMVLDPGITPMEGGVPYYGTWDYSVDGVQGSFTLVEFDTDFDGKPGGVALDYSAAMFVNGEVRFTAGEDFMSFNAIIDARADGTQVITLANGHITRR